MKIVETKYGDVYIFRQCETDTSFYVAAVVDGIEVATLYDGDLVFYVHCFSPDDVFNITQSMYEVACQSATTEQTPACRRAVPPAGGSPAYK